MFTLSYRLFAIYFTVRAVLLSAAVTDLTEDVWRFHIGDHPAYASADFDDSAWQRVSLPHTWNALDAQDGKPRLGERRSSGYRRTATWYRQTVDIPEEFSNQRTFLRCHGASLVKHVYVNGQLVGEHRGAFTAFSFEITDHVTAGEKAVIAIRVDNSEHPERNLVELALEPGRKTLDIVPLRGDFNLYGGIYRDIELVAKPALCISPVDFASPGVYISMPEVSAERAVIRVETVISVRGTVPSAATLTASLRDAAGRLVAQAEKRIAPSDGSREMIEFSLDSPRLWNGVLDPYLYALEVVLRAEGSDAADAVTEMVGIRSLEFDSERGFVLNGEPIRLRGVNRHQDWQDLGWAVGRAEHEADFRMIREIGANAVRLAHYPQDPYVLELCDRLGLLVMIELPLVGWVDPSVAFQENTKTQLREMIRQYNNHPSIAMWGLWNELMNRAPETMVSPVPLVEALQAIAREEDPTRPTNGAANDTSTRAPGLRAVTDLLSWNLYPGWYGETSPDAMGAEIAQKLQMDGRGKIGISEYGAGASIYQHEDWSDLQQPEPRGSWHPEEYQGYFHEHAWAAIEQSEHLWGSFVWNMFDFAADHRDEGDRPGINDKGLITHDRRVRKDAFFFYQAEWTNAPVIHITSRRYNPRPAGESTIKVYSNAGNVTLTVAGKSHGVGSTFGVVHTWERVALTPGKVEVVASAMINGATVTDTCIWNVIATEPIR
jgi:beta-galactosidase